MPLLQTLTQKINGLRTGNELHPDSYALFVASTEASEAQRTQKFQKLWDYYVRDIKQIRKYLIEALSRSFSDETIERMQLPFFNIVPRIINRVSSAYVCAAERYLHVECSKMCEDGKMTMKPDEAQQSEAELYQEVLAGSNINAKVKTAYRLAKLMDVCHVQVVWRRNHIEYDVFPSHLITVKERPDNYLEPSAVLFKKFQDFGDGDIAINVYWDDESNVILSEDGAVLPNPDNADNQNPYKILPFVPLRIRETESYFGEGDEELIDLNEQINIQLVNAYHNAAMQSHGQPFGVNLGLKEGEFTTGPGVIINVENVPNEMKDPRLEFVNPNPATAEVMAFIDWMIKSAYTQRGLPPFTASTEAMAQSGAAKELDSEELREMREDDIEILRAFEKQLYKVTCAVWNYHNTAQLNPDAAFTIDFETPETTTSELDEWKVKKLKFDLGAWNPAWEFMDEDEGIDEMAALGMVKQNLEVRKMMQDQYGIMPDKQPSDKQMVME